MIKHAWDGYAKYGFGENELKPMAKKGHYAYIFGKSKLGATLVDSLDTLYIAGLYDEFEAAKNWVKESFNIDEVNREREIYGETENRERQRTKRDRECQRETKKTEMERE